MEKRQSISSSSTELPPEIRDRVARQVARNAAIGAASGLLAAWAMNRFQGGWSAARDQLQPAKKGNGADESEPTTVKAADRVSETIANGRVEQPHRARAGEAVHYVFGTFLGAVYGAAASVFPKMKTGFGTAYGAAVWLTADEFLVPAAELAPPASDVAAATHLYGFVSHLVFGSALEGGFRLFSSALAEGAEFSVIRT